MQKKLLIFTLILLLYFTTAATAQPQEFSFFDTVSIHGDLNFGYDYNFGFARLVNNQIQVREDKNLVLDERFRNYLYINNASLNLEVKPVKVAHLNFSGSVLSKGLQAQPLYNIASYQEFKSFLDARRQSTQNLWQRYVILQDINFTVQDTGVNGSFTVGQQQIPFGYETNTTMYQSVVNNPILTPMSEYINFNLRDPAATPYQNSTLVNLRDIGFTLIGNYANFRFFSGVYNGAGPNTFDNNNEKDLFGRFDFTSKDAELGISHWRGKHIFFQNAYATTVNRQEYEMYRTGIHARLGNEDVYLKGETILAQDAWLDKTKIDQFGWYIEGKAALGDFATFIGRYEDFSDNNVLKSKYKMVNYAIKRLIFSLSQRITPNIMMREEYSHSWEDISGKDITAIYANFGVLTANLNFRF